MSTAFPIVILISGHGSNLQAIIDAQLSDSPYQIAAVISNRADAHGLQRAKQAGIPSHVIPHQDFSERSDFDRALREQIDQYQPKLIVLAGFMRRLGSEFVSHYHGRMINVHPSLLPKYRGLDTHQRVLEAGDSTHGISIHFVSDDLDGGPIICQAALNVLQTDTIESLKSRIQALEHHYYPEVISWIAQGRIQLQDDQVVLDGKVLEDSGLQLAGYLAIK